MTEVDHGRMHEASKWWLRSPDPHYKELEGSEVIILVEDGMVTGVYSTKESTSVSILDMDTTDAERRKELDEEREALRAKIDAGELYDVM